jgi:hypothetical protein
LGAVASTILLVLEEGYGYYMGIGWLLYGYWMMDLEVAPLWPIFSVLIESVA